MHPAARRAYLATLLRMPPAWILASMRAPSPGMLRHPVTIALHAIALRRITQGA